MRLVTVLLAISLTACGGSAADEPATTPSHPPSHQDRVPADDPPSHGDRAHDPPLGPSPAPLPVCSDRPIPECAAGNDACELVDEEIACRYTDCRPSGTCPPP